MSSLRPKWTGWVLSEKDFNGPPRAEMYPADLQHHMFMMTLDGKLTLAPISNPQNVLDIGTGTGIWATDFGEVSAGRSILR